jgi:hypothetical protein
LIKTRLQLDKNIVEKAGGIAVRRYRNSWDCIKQVVRQEGIRGLYKGMSASYLGVTESTLQWVLYEQMKKSLAKREERIVLSGREKNIWDRTVEWTGNVGAAGGAKLVAALATYPHEVSFPPKSSLQPANYLFRSYAHVSVKHPPKTVTSNTLASSNASNSYGRKRVW